MASAEGKKLSSTRGSKEGKQLKVGPDLCTACDTGDHAESYCQQCADYLCAECTKSHKRQKRTKQHTLLDVKLTKSMQGQNYNRCPKHSDNFVTKFCEQCNDVMCDICVAENHEGHKMSSVSDCAERVFNLCLDKSKQLQGPFIKIKAAKKNVESKKKSFIHNCTSTEDEIKQRKDKLMNMITEVADVEIARVRSTKTKVESLCVQTVDQLESVLKDCETVATPLVMGTDVNDIVKRILFISSEINDANTKLSTVDQLETIPSMKLGTEDCFSDIYDKTKKYLAINTIKTEIDRPDTTSASDKSVRTPTVATDARIKLVNKYDTTMPLFVSKYVAAGSFIVQYGPNGPVKHISCNTDPRGTDLGILLNASPYEPTPKTNLGRNILTINNDRHVIISKEALYLCNNNRVIHSEYHSADGYIPDRLGYFDQHKFVTLCIKQNKIRYYDTKTLKALETHSITSSTGPCLNVQSKLVLCTSKGNILLETGSHQLTVFTHDGVMKDVVPIHKDYFDCDVYTKCIDKHDLLFGVSIKDTSIHVFDLQGEHRILDKLEIESVWSAGVGNDKYLYVSYYSETDLHSIAKYKYL